MFGEKTLSPNLSRTPPKGEKIKGGRHKGLTPEKKGKRWEVGGYNWGESWKRGKTVPTPGGGGGEGHGTNQKIQIPPFGKEKQKGCCRKEKKSGFRRFVTKKSQNLKKKEEGLRKNCTQGKTKIN